MADEAQNQEVEVAEELPMEESYRDADLSRVFQEAAPEFRDEEIITPEPEEQEKPNEELLELNRQVEELQRQQQELTIKNDILSRQQQVQQPQPTPQPAPAPTPAPVPDDEDEDTVLNSLRDGITKDPAAAILKAIKTLTKGTKGLTSAAVEQAKNEALAMIERKNAYDADRSTSVAQYGELLNNNPEFANLANQIYARITANAPEIQKGVRWSDGATYLALSAAYAQMVQHGRLLPNAATQIITSPPSAPKVVNLRQVKPQPNNPLIGSQQATSQSKGVEGFSPAEVSQMRAAAARLRVPFDKYVDTFKSMQKSDPNFGKG